MVIIGLDDGLSAVPTHVIIWTSGGPGGDLISFILIK